MTYDEIKGASATLENLKTRAEATWATAPSAELVQVSMEVLSFAMTLIIGLLEGHAENEALRELGEQPDSDRVTH